MNTNYSLGFEFGSPCTSPVILTLRVGWGINPLLRPATGKCLLYNIQSSVDVSKGERAHVGLFRAIFGVLLKRVTPLFSNCTRTRRTVVSPFRELILVSIGESITFFARISIRFLSLEIWTHPDAPLVVMGPMIIQRLAPNACGCMLGTATNASQVHD